MPAVPSCPVEAAFTVIGGKWKAGILFRLAGGPLRPAEMLRAMPWISERVLMRQLADLVAAGILVRRQVRARPLVVEYALTAHGETLRPLLAMIGTWGASHRQHAETITVIR